MAKSPKKSEPAGSVRITAKAAGFRRAGMAHPAEPVTHEPGAFDADQLAALEAEPMLVVERIGEAPTGGDKKD